jgi:hypothetical protein
VKTEAAEAMRRKILVPVLIEDIKIPLEFRRLQAADLSTWTGGDHARRSAEVFRVDRNERRPPGHVTSVTETAGAGCARGAARAPSGCTS